MLISLNIADQWLATGTKITATKRRIPILYNITFLVKVTENFLLIIYNDLNDGSQARSRKRRRVSTVSEYTILVYNYRYD